MEDVTVREIKPEDNAAIANIIRGSLEEFNANKIGTVYYDSTTDDLYTLFRKPGSVYFVATVGDRVVGGGGIFPSAGLPPDTAELVKMYLHKSVRGTGLGRSLINTCIAYASKAGYKNLYLESMPELKQALNTYQKFGFEYLDRPMGDTGHHGCDLWMLKKL